MGLIDDRFEKNVFTTSLDFLFNWGRRSSLWWLQFGLACCAIEMISASMARFDLSEAEVREMAELGLLHDRDGAGTFTHFYTATVGEVFFEVVQRVDGYDGYGAPNAGVRLAAQAADR